MPKCFLMKNSLFLAFSLATALFFSPSGYSEETPEEISLWENGAPGSEEHADEPENVDKNDSGRFNVTNVHNPSITPYLPDPSIATGTAVIVAPGGGHKKLCLGHEGYTLGQWFADHGIAAFILKYRLSREEGSPYTLEGNAMDDTRRAIRMIRNRAEEWGIRKDSVGVLGFSAGGELAAYAAMWPEKGDPKATDPIEKEDSRPDFQALIYPGKSDTFTVEKGMPPVFIACGYHDRPDISRGMAEVYLKYKEVGIPAELHIYSNAGHGFGYRPTATNAAGRWTERFREWLVDSKFLIEPGS
ncbi:MAG: 1,4-beta-xylanase [Verrucomicrobiales bacterium]|nr:1,4-beta-xylanase [Verrucomicrobiales bacterium]